jgi:hypothetical protein
MGVSPWTLALVALFGVACGQRTVCNQPASSGESIYDFKQADIYNNTVINLSDYRGKVVIISNVATY